VNKELLDKIKKIVDGRYRYIMLGTLGNKGLSEADKKVLTAAGIDYKNKESLISLVYHHNYHTNPADPRAPKNLAAIRRNLKGKKIKNSAILSTLNDSFKELTEKMRKDTETRVVGLVRESLRKIEMEKLADSSINVKELFKESVSTIKQTLRDTSASGTRDWQRVVLTEMSNAIGYGSTERILDDNVDKAPQEIVVYRVTVNDNITDPTCRKLYGHGGVPPKLYRLSTMLGNGSNYGKKAAEYSAVVGSPHPNSRTSQIIELKPGFAVKTGGSVTYIGLDKWQDYLNKNIIK